MKCVFAHPYCKANIIVVVVAAAAGRPAAVVVTFVVVLVLYVHSVAYVENPKLCSFYLKMYRNEFDGGAVIALVGKLSSEYFLGSHNWIMKRRGERYKK